jgi:hypothetical protein
MMEGTFDNFLTGFIVEIVKNMVSPEVLSELPASQGGRETFDGLKKVIENEDKSNGESYVPALFLLFFYSSAHSQSHLSSSVFAPSP